MAEIGGDDGGGMGLGLGGGGESMEVSDASRCVLEFGDVFSGGVELRSEPRLHLRYSSGVEAAAALRIYWDWRIGGGRGDEIAHRTCPNLTFLSSFFFFFLSEILGFRRRNPRRRRKRKLRIGASSRCKQDTKFDRTGRERA